MKCLSEMTLIKLFYNQQTRLEGLKMRQPRPLFHLFSVFSDKQYNFYKKLIQKMSIQYMALGFEPMTSPT